MSLAKLNVYKILGVVTAVSILFIFLFNAGAIFAAGESLSTPSVNSAQATFSAKGETGINNNKLTVTNQKPGGDSLEINNINSVDSVAYTILHITDASSVAGTTFQLKATANDRIVIELRKEDDTILLEREYTIPGSGPAGSGETAALGESCNQVPCKEGLICQFSGKVLNARICKGIVDTQGCQTTTGVNGETGNELCATGLVCNVNDNFCTNDLGAEKAANTKLGESTTDIRNEINRIISIFLSFLAIVGVIVVIYGGILWATSGGNEEQVSKARKTLISGLIGLILIGIAWTVASYVINVSDSIS